MHIDSPRESSPFLHRTDASQTRGAFLCARSGMGPRSVRLGRSEGGRNERMSSSKTESH
jgi:hypothetical protein